MVDQQAMCSHVQSLIINWLWLYEMQKLSHWLTHHHIWKMSVTVPYLIIKWGIRRFQFDRPQHPQWQFGCDADILSVWCTQCCQFNILRPRQNGRHFADDTFKCIFLKENVRISIKISLKFVPKSPFDNIPALFQIMAWRRPGDKPLSEAMMVSLLMHICVARPQWVNSLQHISNDEKPIIRISFLRQWTPMS